MIAVASGKGGVGKSTVAVNLALALQRLGKRVGLLDADVYGPSVPMMLGLDERPQSSERERIVPLERHGLKAISLGFFIADRPAGHLARADDHQAAHPVPLRGRVGRRSTILVLDLPPGTGDAQLTITQQAPLAGGVIVTTPQDVALLDVQRGIAMFQQVNAPVLGVVENMSYHVCSGCGDRAEIFGHGGGRRMADELEDSVPRRDPAGARHPRRHGSRRPGGRRRAGEPGGGSLPRHRPRRPRATRRARHDAPADRALRQAVRGLGRSPLGAGPLTPNSVTAYPP